MDRNLDDILSVDEVLNYYFESLKETQLHSISENGMASNEVLVLDFRYWYSGFETGGWVLPPVENCFEDLTRRYYGKSNDVSG